MSDERDQNNVTDAGTPPPSTSASTDATLGSSVASPEQATNTSGQTATPQNTAASATGQPLTTSNGTPVAQPAKTAEQKQQELEQQHPLATKIKGMMEVLTGGPQYHRTYDPTTGEPTVTKARPSTAHLGMAIALEALQGALAGGKAKGPNAVGEAGALGAEAGQAQAAQKQKQQEEDNAQASRDQQSRWSTMDNNFKTAQNAVLLGRLDKETHDANVASMKPLLDAAVDHAPITFTDKEGTQQTVASIGDKNVDEANSQDTDKYPASVWNRTLDGTVPRLGSDGKPVYIDWRGRSVPSDTPGAHQAWDNTYTMVHKDTQIPLTRTNAEGKSELQPAVKALLPYAGIIPGVSKQLESAAAGQTLSYSTLSKMTQQANDINMLQSELNSTFTRLNGDKKKSDEGYIDTDETKKAVMDALSSGDLTVADLHNFQKAVVGHGGSTEPWEQLQSMQANNDPAVQNSASKIAALFNAGSNPKDQIGSNLERLRANAAIEKDKEIAEAKNPDHQMVPDQLVKSFPQDIQSSYTNLKPGQVDVLTKSLGAHPSQADLEKVNKQATEMSKQNTAEDIKKTNLNDKEQEQLFNYGTVGTGDKQMKLSLDNAPDSFFVNSRTGTPIPMKMVTATKPSQTEINREQFAKSALHSMGKVRELVETTEAKYGPVDGPISAFMAKHGLGDKFTQELQDYMMWTQSAATGAHVGGRFNIAIMNKSESAINATMNKSQLYGAINATSDVMQGYADSGGRLTVEQWKSLPLPERQRLMKQDNALHPNGNAQQVPPGVPKDYQSLIKNAKGDVVAYRDSKGVRQNLGGQ